MLDKCTYFIVGGPEFSHESGIDYRRKKLARYLANQEDTEHVFWIACVNNGLRNIGKSTISCYSDKITNILVYDYKFLNAKLSICNWSLDNLVTNLRIKSISNKFVLIFTLPRFSFLSQSFTWDSIVYDVSDLWVGQYKSEFSVNKRLITWHEKRILKNSSLISTSSKSIQDALVVRYAKNSIVCQNGTDYCFFSEALKKKKQDFSYKVGFFGSLLNSDKNKIDFELAYQIAHKNNSYEFIFAGPTSKRRSLEIEKLFSLDNVNYLGELDGIGVRDMLANIDVILLPYKKNDFTSGIFPLKLYECLAAGCYVISYGLKSLEYSSISGLYCLVDVDEFDNIIGNISNMHSFNIINDISDFAKNSDWSFVFNPILNKVRNDLDK